MSSSTDRVRQYADDVIAGRVVAGQHVRASCQRFVDDLVNDRGLVFDEAAVARVFKFFEKILHLNGGQFEGKPFLLHPSQAFILGNIFGWKKADGTRRFRRAYIEVAKGNGKTPLVAGIGLYGMIGDYESRAEIYAAASKKEQAMVLFRDARAMVEQSPALASECHVSGGDHQPNIAFLRQSSFFRPIARDKGKSGPRPHMALCDEVHEHPDRETMEMLERGFKFRRNPLLVMITNSGFDKTSVCWEEHDHAVNVAHGTLQDDSSFSYVCGLDDGDDPLTDPSCWVKANPLLDVTITTKYLAEIVAQAKSMPGKRNGILRLHFCVWTDAESVWMARDMWEACEVAELKSTEGRPCYGGLDLSYKRDLTAFARVWPQSDGTYDAEVTFWSPDETIKDREDIDRVPYRAWRDEGYMLTTPSKTVEYSHVVPFLAGVENLEAVAYDRWRIDLMKQALDAGGIDIPLVEYGQGFKDMTPAIDAIEGAILNGKLRVKYNPVLRWNVASAVIDTDPAGGRKFAKNKSTGRIDGVVALAMAMAMATGTETIDLDLFFNDPIRV